MKYQTLVTSDLLDEGLEHLINILKIDTTNPPGNEELLVDYLVRVFDKEGIPYEVIRSAPNRANIVARISANNPEHGLLLSAHMDVVPADPNEFRYPPFSATIADDFIWARGAVDMKYQLVYNLMTMIAAARNRLELKRDLVFVAVADEEAGFKHGSLYLVENTPQLLEAEYCLTEMGGITFEIGSKRFYPVQVAHRGFIWLKIKTHGQAGHGSILQNDYAAKSLVSCLNKIKHGKLRFAVPEATRVLLNEVSSNMPVVVDWLIRALSSERVFKLVLDRLNIDAELFDYLISVTHDTAMITKIHTGEVPNAVSSKAEAYVDVRILPGTDPDDTLEHIRRLLGSECQIEVLHSAPAYEAPLSSPLMDQIKKAVRITDPTARVVPYLMPGSTDAIAYAKLGIKTYGFGPLPLPKNLRLSDLIHAKDERIPIDGFRFGLSMFIPMVLDFTSNI